MTISRRKPGDLNSDARVNATFANRYRSLTQAMIAAKSGFPSTQAGVSHRNSRTRPAYRRQNSSKAAPCKAPKLPHSSELVSKYARKVRHNATFSADADTVAKMPPIDAHYGPPLRSQQPF